MTDFIPAVILACITFLVGVLMGINITSTNEVKLSANDWECTMVETQGVKLECTEYIRVEK